MKTAPTAASPCWTRKPGGTIDTVTGQSGFVRGTLRGLARERKRMGLGAEQPFVLMGRADGRLTLKDPATGRVGRP